MVVQWDTAGWSLVAVTILLPDEVVVVVVGGSSASRLQGCKAGVGFRAGTLVFSKRFWREHEAGRRVRRFQTYPPEERFGKGAIGGKTLTLSERRTQTDYKHLRFLENPVCKQDLSCLSAS